MVNSRKKNAVINIVIGAVSNLLPIILQFYSRRIFLNYLGVELLGLQGTFDAILGTLALSELGFQTAITYSLYKPLKERNEILIRKIIGVLKRIFILIGIFFLIAPLLLCPFLKYIITGIEITNRIYLYFILTSVGSAATYFLSYKRTLVFADQKEYVSKSIDLCVNIVFTVAQIIAIILYGDFAIYLVINIIRVIISNMLVNVYCQKKYAFLHDVSFDKEVFKEIWTNTKNVFAGRLAGYVYGSTDNLIVSIFLNTISVAYFVNYKMITSKLTSFANTMLTPILPIVGSLLLDKDTKHNEEILRIYTFFRFVITCVIVIPFMILVDKLISLWLGEKYILPQLTTVLLGADMVINLIYTGCVDFGSAKGLFKQDKNIAIVGMLLNIAFSIALVKPCGLNGILIGTVLSQMYFWISRSLLAYKYCFGTFDIKLYKGYCIKVFCYIAYLSITYVLLYTMLIKHIMCADIWNFIGFAILIEIIILLTIILFFYKTSECTYFIDIALRHLKKRI